MAFHGRRVLGTALALLGLALAWLPATASAAEFAIAPGGFSVSMLDAEGHPVNLAGSHPDRLDIDFALEAEGTTPRELVFELPPGLGGNPGAVPECSRKAFEEGEECPAESQVGVFSPETGGLELPIYQLEPGPGELISFASKPGLDFSFAMELRPDDFGFTLTSSNPQQAAVDEGHLTLWGVPADHQEGTAIPRRPFLSAPSRCGPLTFTFRTRSWLEDAPWLSASADTGEPLGGCSDLSFDPQLGLQLSNPVADSSTGLRMDLSMPEEDQDASGRANAQVEDVTIELPAGLTVSPPGVAQLTACSDAQFGLGNTAEAQCPPSSKVGTVTMVAPALREQINGSIYIGEEHPGERFRMLIAAPGPGIVLKFVSGFDPSRSTGGLTATLSGLPPVSFSRLSLNLGGGQQPLLATPLACGPATAVARFVPSGEGPAVVSTSSVAVGALTPATRCPGPMPFAPELLAGSSRPRAGKAGAFWTTLRRRDGEQLPRRFTTELPAGLSASLGSVPLCSDSQLAAGACPSDSKVGSVLAEVGPGPKPASLRGSVYLTGPYRHSPFGMQIEFHAAIGPLDLGTMSFRGAMQVDSETGRVAVTTDRLPETVEGLPVRFQSIELSMDRPGFVRNPTSCSPKSVDATAESQSGAFATATSPFVVHGCKRLGFKPRFEMALEGRKGLRKGGRPVLRVAAHMRPGDTNLRAMKMVFPPALGLDITALKAVCSRLDAINDACPRGARVGTAFARSSLLTSGFRGYTYVVQPKKGGSAPELWLILSAMGVHVALKGESANQNGRLVTKFTGLPDLPLSSFGMKLGEHGDGVFSLASSPCVDGRPRSFVSEIAAKGQNGARRTLHVPIKAKARCQS